MTATIGQVRTALKTTLDAISGLSAYAKLPPTINTPAAVIAPGAGQFLTYKTSQTSHDLELLVAVMVQIGDWESAVDELDAYLADSGSHSIYATVLADHKLGGLVDSAEVMHAQNYGQITYNSVDYLGCEFAVAVLL